MDRNFLKEKVPHGTTLFPVALYTISRGLPARETLYCHWHEEFEFLVVTRGGADFHIGAADFRVREGEAVFVCPNQLHSASAADGLPCDFFAVVVNPSFLSSFTNDAIQQKYIDGVLSGRVVLPVHIRACEAWEAKVVALLYEIRELYLNKPAAYELMIKGRLYEIWALMLNAAESRRPVPVFDSDYRVERVKTVLHYIHQHYSQRISLAELAASIHMSEGQFCRFFKKMVRMSAFEYINGYRVNMSAVLLRDTDRKISDIAGMVGFNNVSYFTRTFRKAMHCSPAEYRSRRPA